MKFSVDGTKYEFDEEKMSFGEGRELEQKTGYPIGELPRHTQGDAMEMTVVQAFIWVAMRRENPDLKFSDLDDMSLGDVEFHNDEEPEGEGEPANPTPGDDSTPTGSTPAASDTWPTSPTSSESDPGKPSD